MNFASAAMLNGLMSLKSSVSYLPRAAREIPVASDSYSSVRPLSVRKSLSRSGIVSLMFISTPPLVLLPIIAQISISVEISAFRTYFPTSWIYGNRPDFSLNCTCRETTVP